MSSKPLNSWPERNCDFAILLDYLYCQVQQPEFRDSLAQGASGTSNSHQRLRPQDFLAKRIVLPPTSPRITFHKPGGLVVDLLGLADQFTDATQLVLKQAELSTTATDCP